MKTNIYQEICCDVCGDTIHNHFDCPVCNTERGYQGTDQYSYILSDVDKIKCEECNTEFQRVNKDDYWYDTDIKIDFADLSMRRNKSIDNILNKTL